jgi:hypothetical protein
MNMKLKDERNVVIRLPKEHFDKYDEYLKIIKKKASNVMGHNLQIFLKGMEDTIEDSKGKEKKSKR